MNIVCIEPLSVSQQLMDGLSDRIEQLGHQCICYGDRPGSQKETALRMRDADIAVITDLPVTQAVIEKTKHLKLLVIAFSSKDHVDLEACNDRGIRVIQIEGYSAFAVAELAVAMMISLLRDMIKANNAMRTGEHELPYMGEELHGKTIGIIGLGDVGVTVARIMNTFGCRVIAYDLTPSGEAYQAGVTYVKLEQLFKESDILSIHCPLTEQTEGMVTYELLSTMKPTAYVINVGRGPVIEMDGLLRALQEGCIAGVGIDTKEKTKMEKDHRLLEFDQAIVTPHIGYRTRESFERRLEAVQRQILGWIEEQKEPEL